MYIETNHAEASARLARLARFIDRLPETIPTPTHLFWAPYLDRPEMKWLLFGNPPCDQKALAARIVRSLGGTWDEIDDPADGDLFRFQRVMGGILLEVVVDRLAVRAEAVAP